MGILKKVVFWAITESKACIGFMFIILERAKPPEIPLRLGLGDDFYLHQKSLITESEKTKG